MAEIFTTYISLGIATASILFVLWDHYKDDRILSKRVQNFYKNIEGLIFSNYKMKINVEKFEETKETCYETEFFKYQKQNVYYRGIVNQVFEDMAKYVGLTYHKRPNYYYTKDNDYFIDKIGDFYNLYCQLNNAIQLGNKFSFYNEQLKKTVVDTQSIKIINDYLETLRKHWNKYYFKRILRKKLKPKIDFNEFLD